MTLEQIPHFDLNSQPLLAAGAQVEIPPEENFVQTKDCLHQSHRYASLLFCPFSLLSNMFTCFSFSLLWGIFLQSLIYPPCYCCPMLFNACPMLAPHLFSLLAVPWSSATAAATVVRGTVADAWRVVVASWMINMKIIIICFGCYLPHCCRHGWRGLPLLLLGDLQGGHLHHHHHLLHFRMGFHRQVCFSSHASVEAPKV